MKLYDVSGLRASYVRPGTNLTAWAAAQRPDALCNASLYDMKTRVPVGTVIESGQLVHNDGNGYGFGVADGKIVFGRPWDRAWDFYLTGYTACVLDGQYVPPSFTDRYVFDCALARIGMARMKDGRVCVVTDDGVTLKQFAEHAIAQGADILVNLDGGGSRHLVYGGKTVYASGRVPYNAIAFYDVTNGYKKCKLYNDGVGCCGRNDDVCRHCPGFSVFKSAVNKIVGGKNV